jgi:hypothetical protein
MIERAEIAQHVYPAMNLLAEGGYSGAAYYHVAHVETIQIYLRHMSDLELMLILPLLIEHTCPDRM